MTDATDAARRWLREHVGTLLRGGVAIGLLVFLATRVSWSEMLEVAARGRPDLLAAAVVVFAADRLFMSWKWKFLLEKLGVSSRFRDTTEWYFLGGTIALVLQWNVSGDISRAIGVSRRTGETDIVVVSVFLEKLLGLAASAGLSCLSLFVINRELSLVEPPVVWALTVIVFVAFAATPLLLVSARLGQVLGSWVRRLPERVSKYLSGLDAKFGAGSADRLPALWIFSLLTFAEQLSDVLVVLLLVEAFGLDLSPLVVFAVTPPVMLLSRLPISLEGLGLREGLYVFFFGLFGASEAASFLVALAKRIVDTAVIFSGAGLFMLGEAWGGAAGIRERLSGLEDVEPPPRPAGDGSPGESDGPDLPEGVGRNPSAAP